MMNLIANQEGKLHVQRQVEDYALRGVEFESMGFLTFTVETYERRMSEKTNVEEEREDETDHSTTNPSCHYLTHHPKSDTHFRVCRSENHSFLPNIVGSWLPRRDGEESTRSYYYAAMLSFLKPWRDLRELMNGYDNWENAFNAYMRNASQRDKDVVAGCQYYYDSRNVAASRDVEEMGFEGAGDVYEDGDDETDHDVDNDLRDESLNASVSFFLFP
jgi:hypothetical protein